jgi:hypothetical protein
MTVKDYLSELQEMREDIELKKELRLEYLDRATSTTVHLNDIRVQASKPDNGSVERYSTQAVDLEREIIQDELYYHQRESLVMDQIRELHNIHFIRVLFKVYVQFKNLKIAASEMNMSYNYVLELHKQALRKFSKVHAADLAEWKEKNAERPDRAKKRIYEPLESTVI